MAEGHFPGFVTIYGGFQAAFYQILCLRAGEKHVFAIWQPLKVKENLHFSFKML